MTTPQGQTTTVEAEPVRAWHALSAPAVLDDLETGPTGLPDRERTRRLERFGPNTPGARKPEPWWHEVMESFTEPLQLLLIAVAILAAIFGELSDAIAIGSVVILVSVLEAITEIRADRAIAALRAMTAPSARLLREDGVVQVPTAELVPGDVLVVEAGDVVPADARVLVSYGLQVDESSLTGESVPADKSDHAVAESTVLAERSSLLHAGSPVLAGAGRAVVVATGDASELGKLGKLVTYTKEPPTPLQQALAQLAKAALIVAIAASVLVPGLGLIDGQPWRLMLLSGLTLAFATVPEELPILITLLLAIGGRKLARRGAMLRRLRAGETLGAVTTVVADKTGTLTENHLQLAEIVGDRRTVLAVALACQPTDATHREPLELELATAASELGLTRDGAEIAVYPFDPTRNVVSRVHATGDSGVEVAVTGAPEAVLDRCTLDAAARQEIDQQVTQLSERGLRVIAFARRELPSAPAHRDQAEYELSYVGLAAFDDPLRPGVPEAVAALAEAGVNTIVVTGDHPATATAIAIRTGLPAAHTLSGAEVDAMSDEELDRYLVHGNVIARATPSAKHRVVQLLQRRRELVAVTGDGANDAPALAAADVGIALGRRAADLARDAADLILADDAYPRVVDAVATGRNLTAQLRRAVSFYLGAKIGLVLILLIAIAAGLPTPYDPVHLVLLEVFMDIGATIAFVAEPAAPQAMHRPPRRAGAHFLDRDVLTAMGITAGTMTLAVLPAYILLHAAGASTTEASAGAVLAWMAAHVLIAWTLRTKPGLAWTTNLAFPIWAAAALVVGVASAITPVGTLIHLTPLPMVWLGVVLAFVAGATIVAAVARRAVRLSYRL